MKRNIIGGLAISALLIAATLSVASAADMAVKAPPPPPPVAAASWTGFYVGGNAGYSWGNWTSTSMAAIFPGPSTTASPNVNGWFGGLQGGYNWQVSPRWLVGIEGDYDWSGERASDGSSSSTSSLGSPIFCLLSGVGPPCTESSTGATRNDWKLPWFATLRARAGFLVDRTWLLYGTGGLAFAGTKFATSSSTTFTITGAGGLVAPGFPITTSSAFSGTDDRVGFALGAGIEKSLSQYWSVKAEYLFLDFGSHTFLVGTGVDTKVKLIDNIARVGINYHFGGGR